MLKPDSRLRYDGDMDAAKPRRWFSFTLRTRIFLVAAVLLAIGGITLVRHCVYASFAFCWEAEFANLPQDDRELEAWLKAQPGIVAHTVLAGRGGPRKNLVKVLFVQTRNLAGEPKLPDLDSYCSEHAYGGPAFRFRDCGHASVP